MFYENKRFLLSFIYYYYITRKPKISYAVFFLTRTVGESETKRDTEKLAQEPLRIFM